MISERVNKIIEDFSGNKSWEDKYKQIIDLGKTLNELPEDQKNDSNIVKGCQSQVWLVSHFENGKIKFTADSDAQITKGIVALLVYIYSDSTPDEIINLKTEFIDTIGLRQHLSMNRSNGLTSMMKQIQIYALAYKTKIQMGLIK